MSQPAKLSRIAALFSLLILAAAWLFSRSPARVEAYYSEAAFPWVAAVLSRMNSLAPFSLAEPLLLASLLMALGALARPVFRLFRGRPPFRAGPRQAFWTLAAATGLTLASGYLFWGLNYARPEAAQRLGWLPAPPGAPDASELAGLCAQAIELANAAREQAGGQPPLAESELDRALDSGFANASETLGLEPLFRIDLGPAKPIWLSGVLSRFGISGFYFPWTGEANFNDSPPRVEKIHSIAHEKAHQRGVAGEDEANFYGYLACAFSSKPEVRYAGRLFAQRQLLRQLSRVDPVQARLAAARRSEGVLRDEAEIRAFWKRFQGPATEVGAVVNDSYLRLHGVPGGIESYDRSVRLLVLLARRRGGSLD